MEIKELIAELNSYPPDMTVAKKETPFEDVEIRVRHAESDDHRVKGFDFVSIE